jgi:hypothetical protein
VLALPAPTALATAFVATAAMFRFGMMKAEEKSPLLLLTLTRRQKRVSKNWMMNDMCNVFMEKILVIICSACC